MVGVPDFGSVFHARFFLLLVERTKCVMVDVGASGVSFGVLSLTDTLPLIPVACGPQTASGCEVVGLTAIEVTSPADVQRIIALGTGMVPTKLDRCLMD